MRGIGHKAERRAQSAKRAGKYAVFFALCAMFYASIFCYADDKESFYAANSFYGQGNFNEAIKQYGSILESGLESGNLYYNLGNCYFKKGELGKALLNYEKARRLIPLDKDLESNYEYARSLIKGGAVVSQKSLPAGALDNLFGKFTVDGLTLMLSALFMLIFIGILISLFFRPFKKHALIFAAFLGLLFIVGLVGLRGKVAVLNKEAIIIAARADARFEPMDKATTYFTLYEGMKVEVISSKDNWHKVRRQDNKSGWIENSALAVF